MIIVTNLHHETTEPVVELKSLDASYVPGIVCTEVRITWNYPMLKAVLNASILLLYKLVKGALTTPK